MLLSSKVDNTKIIVEKSNLNVVASKRGTLTAIIVERESSNSSKDWFKRLEKS